MPVSFFMYSARDFVLLFVTKTTCLPWRMVRVSQLLGRRYSPLLRSIFNTSTVPSNKWSPDHKTPILLTSSAIVRASARKNVPAMVMAMGVGCYTYHRNRKGRPTTLVSRSTNLCLMLGRIMRSTGFQIQSQIRSGREGQRAHVEAVYEFLDSLPVPSQILWLGSHDVLLKIKKRKIVQSRQWGMEKHEDLRSIAGVHTSLCSHQLPKSLSINIEPLR